MNRDVQRPQAKETSDVRIVSIDTSSLEPTQGLSPQVIGLPFAIRTVFDTSRLYLLTEDGYEIQAYFEAVAFWPDGSLKWVRGYFLADESVLHSSRLSLYARNESQEASTGRLENRIQVLSSENKTTINTGRYRFGLDHSSPSQLKEFTDIETCHFDSIGSSLVLKNENAEALEARVKSVKPGDMENPFQYRLSTEGGFYTKGNSLFANYGLTLTFYGGLALLKCDFSIHNPRAAEHPKGVWDLGDEGSIRFGELSLELTLPEGLEKRNLKVNPETDSQWKNITAGKFALVQESSGGENWDSNNHVNACNEIPDRFRGYRIFADGIETAGGLRAEPRLMLESNSIAIQTQIINFWQNFPKGIEVEGNAIRLQLFPGNFSDCYELQGGEQKTHTMLIDFSGDEGALDWCQDARPLAIVDDYMFRSCAIPLLPPVDRNRELTGLIDFGIIGPHNFFQKREQIDEYGWRNFGDTYADHEELEYRGSLPLISHYNNQYDVLDCFLKQFLMTRNPHWFDLAEPLARHIVDIDIYNTNEDRDEYNGGLFWHTDHYSNAFTCTHRTFSNKNTTSYDGKVGGGPASEHCYTTGLANLYFITGDDEYREAAIGLIHWIERTFEGSGGVLERLYKFVSRDLKVIRKLLKGKQLPKYFYPFTRATGNYVSALLDGYQLTSDREYLIRCEKVIRHTFHPADEITLRNLGDVELTWSYLIFLQSVCKYLFVKAVAQEFDEDYYYVREALLHYAEWIAVNEKPFMTQPERLEFPNLTWVAQDLRKAYILAVAAALDNERRDEYRSRSVFFEDYVVEELSCGEKNYYTRILTILMQNELPDLNRLVELFGLDKAARKKQNHSKMPTYSISGILTGLLVDLFKCFRRLSFTNELRWMRFRLKSRS